MVQTVAMFDDIFPSYVTARSISEEPLMWNKIHVTQKGPMTRTLLSNPWMANNVTKHMARLATALTNAIRSSRPNEEQMLGDAWRDEIFISVRWAWLIFPFILLILGLVSLVSTMIKTSKDGDIGVWKTSAMPTLIYSLPQDVQRELSSSRTDDKTEAKKVRIKLLPDEGWRVSKRLCIS
jgi:hypothetical protein